MAHVGYATLVVRDYDEALIFYTESLGFKVIEDTPLGDGKRWLLIAPPGAMETSLLLAKAATPEQSSPYAIRQEGVSFSFFTPMTSGAITSACRQRALSSPRSRH